MTGSCRPPSISLRLLLLTTVVATVNCQAPEWYTKHTAAAMTVEQYTTCKNIGIYCGAAKCCKGLVCQPVKSQVTGNIAPRCSVPDASTMDSNACYDHLHICYFHNQCCSGRCEDLDADHIFECTGVNKTGWIPERDVELESVDWGSVDDTVPVLAIVMSFVVIVALIAIVATKLYRRSRNQYQNLGVDELPAEGWQNNDGGGKYVLGWHDELIHEYKPDESVDSSTDLSGPPLPPRDYSAEPMLDADESSQFSNVCHSTPVRPVVDYE